MLKRCWPEVCIHYMTWLQESEVTVIYHDYIKGFLL